MDLTIGQAAKTLSVSVHTLRYYEKEGLLLSVNRDERGNRIYTPSDIQWIYMILCLRDTGMHIRDIKEYISLFKQGTKTIPKRKELLIDFRESIENQIQRFHRTQAMLEKKIAYYCNMEESVQNGKNQMSDHCYDYYQEWEDFKQILKETSNE